MKKPFFLYIDIVGRCNLACPSCPQGNDKARLDLLYMDQGLLHEILEKATREAVIFGVGLFNWGEPFLHPNLSDMVRTVKEHGLLCYLSSNFNRAPHLSRVIFERPHSLRISCSGFTQPIYERTHNQGNIEQVKENMVLLSKMKRSTKVHMLWHRYQHNTHEEPLMREFCTKLGFEFKTVEAYYMPLETVLDVWDGVAPMPKLDENLLTSLDEHRQLCAGRSDEVCRNQTQEITIDAKGDVQLCCGVYNPNRFNLGQFLDQSLEEIQAQRFSHSFCESCMESGGHVYSMGHSKTTENRGRRWAKAAYRKVAPLVPQVVLSKFL